MCDVSAERDDMRAALEQAHTERVAYLGRLASAPSFTAKLAYGWSDMSAFGRAVNGSRGS